MSLHCLTVGRFWVTNRKQQGLLPLTFTTRETKTEFSLTISTFDLRSLAPGKPLTAVVKQTMADRSPSLRNKPSVRH
ncbi:probable aconitate hydratase, mitochondrial [Oryzias melastigma]|uniref:probable aconitate hydratase, mitochondrial n=1 Tax=Oryzias melastigma TaxID=30732 RepID=UPI000CF7C5C0|nr:probable aconitate hydratase, mitochondrial [Oryzias melastigma]